MTIAFGYAVLSVLAISLVSLVGIATVSMNERLIRRVMHFFIGLAAGALLGDAFIHLIPEALASGITDVLFALSILAGMLTFLVIEKYLHWYNGQVTHQECIPGTKCVGETKKPLGTLILFGDGVHNFVDGAIIAASYVVSIPLGVATTVAVFLHEVPQEISDFALLLHAGYTRVQALFWNLVSALVALIGAFSFLLIGGIFESIEPLAAAFTAGGFIYIAAVNLVPELISTKHPGRSAVEFIAVLIGIAVMFALLLLE